MVLMGHLRAFSFFIIKRESKILTYDFWICICILQVSISFFGENLP